VVRGTRTILIKETNYTPDFSLLKHEYMFGQVEKSGV
jgi:hypothetical protein